MDIEFHYYMTYLIAVRAGFEPNRALTIARACHSVDENTSQFCVSKGKPDEFENYISQTYSLLKPQRKRLRIYPIFHFVPGDPDADSALRADDAKHPINTTPDNDHAKACLSAALGNGDLFRIGIGCHAYADTWAHQNFVGFCHEFDGMGDWLPDIGHADAKSQPDIPNLTWTDNRLIKANQCVNNKQRFLAAAGRLFDNLRGHVRPMGEAPTDDDADKDALITDLDSAIGPTREGGGNPGKAKRIDRYIALGGTTDYGSSTIPEYRDWLTRELRRAIRTDQDPDAFYYYWRDAQNYVKTPWFCFQKAVKDYQDHALSRMRDLLVAQLTEEDRERF